MMKTNRADREANGGVIDASRRVRTRGTSPDDPGHAPTIRASQAVHDAVALRTRIRRTLDAMPVASGRRREVMQGWLALMPTPEPAADDPVDFSVWTDAACTQLAWAASGATGVFRDLILDLFSALNVSSEERLKFQLAIPQLRPPTVGTWIHMSGRGFDGGWMIRAPIPLDRAQMFAPMSEPYTVFSAWTSRRGLDMCSLLSRSVGDGTPYTDMVMELPPSSPQAQCALAIEAMETLGVTGFSSAAASAIGAAEPGPIGLAVRLFDGGVAKVGLVIPAPSNPLLFDLSARMRTRDSEAIDMFQRALRVDGPSYAEFSLVASGLELLLHYTPRATVLRR